MSYTGGMASTFEARHKRATDAALEAGAQELINGLKDQNPLGLAGGYKTGAFVTGNLLGSLDKTDPYTHEGVRAISVYTDLVYAEIWEGPPGSKWESGHYNIFSRKQEQPRKRWYPTLHRKQEDILAAYWRVYKRFMGG
jgi:hypothetical protein